MRSLQRRAVGVDFQTSGAQRREATTCRCKGSYKQPPGFVSLLEALETQDSHAVARKRSARRQSQSGRWKCRLRVYRLRQRTHLEVSLLVHCGSKDLIRQTKDGAVGCQQCARPKHGPEVGQGSSNSSEDVLRLVTPWHSRDEQGVFEACVLRIRWSPDICNAQASLAIDHLHHENPKGPCSLPCGALPALDILKLHDGVIGVELQRVIGQKSCLLVRRTLCRQRLADPLPAKLDRRDCATWLQSLSQVALCRLQGQVAEDDRPFRIGSLDSAAWQWGLKTHLHVQHSLCAAQRFIEHHVPWSGLGFGGEGRLSVHDVCTFTETCQNS
mmetsp:Transcript_22624/g.41964  ORF Transcript_22624/g.41964 Transcript_22624/m.41964 type:complete len:328 (-) Transcript_22624:223-1206(-)